MIYYKVLDLLGLNDFYINFIFIRFYM
jgi:hypothetical protein